jgi:hypothetical protein
MTVINNANARSKERLASLEIEGDGMSNFTLKDLLERMVAEPSDHSDQDLANAATAALFRIGALELERDEARAEVRALCGDHAELSLLLLPTDWYWHDGLFPCWINRKTGFRVVNTDRGCGWGAWPVTHGTEPTPLAAMRAADAALEAKS